MSERIRIVPKNYKGLAVRLLLASSFATLSSVSISRLNKAEDGIDEIIRTSRKNIIISPDHTSLAYVEEDTDPSGHSYKALKVMDANGSQKHEFVVGYQESLDNIEWFPDSKRLAFSYAFSSFDDPTGKINDTYEIFVIDVGSGKVITVTAWPRSVIQK